MNFCLSHLGLAFGKSSIAANIFQKKIKKIFIITLKNGIFWNQKSLQCSKNGKNSAKTNAFVLWVTYVLSKIEEFWDIFFGPRSCTVFLYFRVEFCFYLVVFLCIWLQSSLFLSFKNNVRPGFFNLNFELAFLDPSNHFDTISCWITTSGWVIVIQVLTGLSLKEI